MIAECWKPVPMIFDYFISVKKIAYFAYSIQESIPVLTDSEDMFFGGYISFLEFLARKSTTRQIIQKQMYLWLTESTSGGGLMKPKGCPLVHEVVTLDIL